MKLNKWIKLGIVGSVVVLLVSIASLALADQSSGAPASLASSGGLVQFRSYGSPDWQTVTKGVGIHVGDEIRTGNDGAATLSIGPDITFKLFPDSYVQLQGTSIGSTLRVKLSQFVGITLTTVDHPLKTNESVAVITPATVATVHGTAFFTFVSSRGSTAFIGQDHEVIVKNFSGVTVKNGADNATYYQVGTSTAQICTVDFLNKSGQGFTFADLSQPTDQQKLRDFLVELFQSNVNANLMSFLRSYLGLSPTANIKDIQDKLSTFDKPGQLSDFLAAFHNYLTEYFAAMSTGNMPPGTCGNGKADPGETADNCRTDVTDLTRNGNGLCETDHGKSLINDTTDCFSFARLIMDCNLVMLNGGFPMPTSTPLPPPTWTPWPPDPGQKGKKCVTMYGTNGVPYQVCS